jgi:hypothetical protein
MDKAIGQIKNYFLPDSINNFRPRILERKSAIFLLVVFIFVEVIFLSLAVFLPKNVFFADISSIAIFDSVNRSRQKLDLAPLTVSEELSKAAEAKARDMLARGYFSHIGPEGAEPWYWIKKAGYDYVYAGENLARGFIDANSVFNAWMKSAGHRDNILNHHHTEIGVAVLSGNMAGRETTLVVQMFGSRSKAGVAPLKTDSGRPLIPEVNKLTKSFVSDISGISQNIFAAGLFFVFLIFLLNIFIHRQVQYQDLIFNGLILIVVILGVMILNHRLIGLNLEILNGISI